MNAGTSREKRSSDKGQIENVIAFPKRRHGENRCDMPASAFADLAEIAIAAGMLGILALTERNRRIELHDPDRAIDEEKNRIAKELMRWQMKYFGSPYAITASTVDIGTTELEKILREYLQASREKSVVN